MVKKYARLLLLNEKLKLYKFSNMRGFGVLGSLAGKPVIHTAHSLSYDGCRPKCHTKTQVYLVKYYITRVLLSAFKFDKDWRQVS